MLRRSLRVLAPLLPPRAGRADLVLRFQVDALRGIRAVVDPHVWCSSASRAFASSAHRSRQSRSSPRSFQAATLLPNRAPSASPS